jgi:hypothetical protein
MLDTNRLIQLNDNLKFDIAYEEKQDYLAKNM